MNALVLMLVALAVLTVGYRFYGAFIAARILALDDSRPTPAAARPDGRDFVATPRWVLFGHHFAAITGAGPLIGPVLACQYGYAPGFLWLVAGVVLAGSVHDCVILVASVRHGGRSLAGIAREEMSPLAGGLASAAILVVLVMAVAAMTFAVVNSMKRDAWGAFTLASTVPLAVVMGLWMRRGGPRAILWASLLGVFALFAVVALGGWATGLPSGAPARALLERSFSTGSAGIAWAVAAYGFLASVLPVWLLLTPRDYLSSYLKLGTIAALVLGVLWVHPPLAAPAVSAFVHGGGPIIAGKLFPFCFLTIACGAISGFHALIASGTTPKMLARESDARPIGYGAMLCEGLVGVTCLIAAAALHPEDYYAINATADVFAKLGMHPIDLAALEQAVGTHLAGKTGGAVSLAVGIAKVFAGLPFVRAMPRLLAYWYHFAIVFEGMFILTTVDAGTRVARFLLQEVAGRLHPKLGETGWAPGAFTTTAAVVAAWSWLVFAALRDPRGMGVLWTMLGVTNQLLAVIALTVATSWLVNLGRARYAWVTLAPLAWVTAVTFSGGFLSISGRYWQMIRTPQARPMGILCALGIATVMGCTFAILVQGARRWLAALRPAPAAPATAIPRP